MRMWVVVGAWPAGNLHVLRLRDAAAGWLAMQISHNRRGCERGVCVCVCGCVCVCVCVCPRITHGDAPTVPQLVPEDVHTKYERFVKTQTDSTYRYAPCHCCTCHVVRITPGVILQRVPYKRLPAPHEGQSTIASDAMRELWKGLLLLAQRRTCRQHMC